jgi:TIR domain
MPQIEIDCPQCAAPYSLGEEMLGEKVKCAECGTKFFIGEDGKPKAAPAAEAAPSPPAIFDEEKQIPPVSNDPESTGNGPEVLPETQPWRYCAFISYRHGGRDGQIAEWLAKSIERYRLPRAVIRQYGLPQRVGRVFRDEEELPTSASLSEQIEQALRASRFIVVICSPRLQHSKWCRREIELFQSLRGRDHMLAVLVDGDPSKAGGADDPFPPELRYLPSAAPKASSAAAAIEDEPIAADLRRGSGLFDGELRRRALLRIVAGLVGCNFDDLYERDKRRARQRNLTLGVLGTALVCILVALGIWGLRSKAAIAIAQSAGDGRSTSGR